ncbi:MAG: hypothetical protein C4292_06935, partial [Nitrososphaera sp.]
MRSYKFRLYPNNVMEKKLVETLDGCRWVYIHEKLPPAGRLP